MGSPGWYAAFSLNQRVGEDAQPAYLDEMTAMGDASDGEFCLHCLLRK